jgi:SAM-dependent methyltransferase
VKREGWEGWDQYAPFYDWENTRTFGRRDVPFWRRVALDARGLVLELGCGTGRISKPLARAGVRLVGIDRSAPMLARLRAATKRTRMEAARMRLVRGDIRELPFAAGTFSAVLAPYGILQSLIGDGDLAAALGSVARVLAPGGVFAVDLVPDLARWREYHNRVRLRGRSGRGTHLTLVESVRQDRARRLTTFDERYIERRKGGATEHRFELTFRTLSIPQMTARLDRAGLTVDRVLGDYRDRPWDRRAEVWIILARRW